MMAEETIFEKLLTISIWVLGAITIYWLILKLTGHSPTAMQIMMSIGGFMSGLVIYHQQKLGQLAEFKRNTEKEFERMHHRFDKIENVLVTLQKDIAYIRAKVE